MLLVSLVANFVILVMADFQDDWYLAQCKSDPKLVVLGLISSFYLEE